MCKSMFALLDEIDKQQQQGDTTTTTLLIASPPKNTKIRPTTTNNKTHTPPKDRQVPPVISNNNTNKEKKKQKQATQHVQNNPDLDEFPMSNLIICTHIKECEVAYYKIRNTNPFLSEVNMELYHSLKPV